MDRRSMWPAALISAMAVGCGAAGVVHDGRDADADGTWLASLVVPSQTVLIDAGTEIVIRLDSQVSTATHRVGDSVRARLAEPVVVAGQVVLEPGARVYGRVVELDPASRAGDRARLGVEFNGVGTSTGMTDILASYRLESNGRTPGPQELEVAVAVTNRRPQATLASGSTLVLELDAPAEVRLRS